MEFKSICIKNQSPPRDEGKVLPGSHLGLNCERVAWLFPNPWWKKIPSQPQGHAYSQIKLFLSMLHGQISSRREKEKKKIQRETLPFKWEKSTIVKSHTELPLWTPRVYVTESYLGSQPQNSHLLGWLNCQDKVWSLQSRKTFTNTRCHSQDSNW